MQIAARQSFLTGRAVPTARDYVQDGLVAMWDGIENAGWGQHDNATRMIDLLGTFASFPCASMGTDCANVRITDKLRLAISAVRSVEFSGSIVGYSAAVLDNGIFTTTVSGSSQYGGVYTYGGIRIGNPTLRNNKVWIGVTSANSVLENAFIAADAGERFTVSLVSGDSSSVMYHNGAVKNNPTIRFYNQTWCEVNGLTGTTNRGGAGEYCCIRLYSHALTAAEVAANFAVDAARFRL